MMLEKILLIVAFVFAGLSMVMGVALSLQTSRLAKAQKTITAQAADHAKLRDAVSRQNDLISAYQIDIANARAEAQVLTDMISEDAKDKKIKVVERLVKDNSCEERLKIVEELLDEFYSHD